MNMKTTFTTQKPDQTGSALMLTMIMSAVALAILAAAMSWSASSTRLTYRSIQYNQSVAAAEAATEKVVSQINQDFLSGRRKFGHQQPEHLSPEHGALAVGLPLLEHMGIR